MSTYEAADEAQHSLLAHALESWHGRLHSAGVRVALLVAFGAVNKDGEKTGAAIKHQGVPALAVVRVVPLRDRVLGLADALITIDGDAWPDLTRPERLALLDHELTHLVLPSGKNSDPALDDHGRPILRLRPHDHQFGWFDTVADRHGQASQEVQQARRFANEVGQLYLWEPTKDEAPGAVVRDLEPLRDLGEALRALKQSMLLDPSNWTPEPEPD